MVLLLKLLIKLLKKEVTIIAAAPTWLFPSPGSQSLEAKIEIHLRGL